VSTEQVLDALRHHGASATFFVLVRRAERHPTLLREVLAAGHQVALHGIDHRRLTRLSPPERRAGLSDGRARLEDLVQQKVTTFRPPYGGQTLAVWQDIRRAGMRPVFWGPVAGDWEDAPMRTLVANALRGIGSGSIVLAHDGFAGATDGACDGPAPRLDRGELTRRVLDGMTERGLAAVHLDDLLRAGRPRLEARFRR
jgi:peptidoglycan/xylan/chitin deacetylase (PgdA/CDA1 family)